MIQNLHQTINLLTRTLSLWQTFEIFQSLPKKTKTKTKKNKENSKWLFQRVPFFSGWGSLLLLMVLTLNDADREVDLIRLQWKRWAAAHTHTCGRFSAWWQQQLLHDAPATCTQTVWHSSNHQSDNLLHLVCGEIIVKALRDRLNHSFGHMWLTADSNHSQQLLRFWTIGWWMLARIQHPEPDPQQGF